MFKLWKLHLFNNNLFQAIQSNKEVIQSRHIRVEDIHKMDTFHEYLVSKFHECLVSHYSIVEFLYKKQRAYIFVPCVQGNDENKKCP